MTTELKTAATLLAFVNNAECWSPYRAMARNVFLHYPNLALSIEQIEGVARAIDGLPQDASLKDALTFLVRRKALRTRKGQNGKRLYEVNF